MDELIEIELFGQAYTFKASGQVSEPQEIADYVAGQVGKARDAAEAASKFDALIRTVLNIANDYFEMRRSRQSLVRDIDDRCQVLIDHLETNM
ncbi:MAG: cell division protein ZapA [Deltaproteobacteria bacterium]|nr:cell division protein ZapA [Deltaproteobacteria bacterium]